MAQHRKLSLLNMLFLASVFAANIMAIKLFSLFGVAMPSGVIAFPITFLMTDVINEIWGREEANYTVKLGFIANILASVLIFLAVKLPPYQYWEMQEMYAAVLTSVPRITAAGLISFLVSQKIDVELFHFFKIRHKGRKLWIRNNVSTIASQLIDSAMFITIAFYGVMPTNALIGMIFTQWGVKTVLALLDTPFCYVLVRWVEED